MMLVDRFASVACVIEEVLVMLASVACFVDIVGCFGSAV